MEISDRIHEIAVDNCPDYPNIANVPLFEQLWAIETTLKGTSMACDDWLNFTRYLFKKYNIPESEIENFYEKNS